MREPRTILITGASSGIGAALADAYAAEGVTLILTGRDLDRLDQVAERCRQAGATVRHATVDVTEAEFMATWLKQVDEATPIDLAIANAGISGGTGGTATGESAEQARRIFATNLDGVLNTVLPLADRMVERAQRRRQAAEAAESEGKAPRSDGPVGQIAIVSSLAGFRGLPGAPSYSGSKAAVRVWGEAMRVQLKPKGVAVNVVCPGFIRTPLTDRNPYKMPFLMEADAAARLIRRNLAKDKGRIAFPWPMHALVWLMAALPTPLTDRLLKKSPKKPAL
jgi:short-subunit dehydrogenase